MSVILVKRILRRDMNIEKRISEITFQKQAKKKKTILIQFLRETRFKRYSLIVWTMKF